MRLVPFAPKVRLDPGRSPLFTRCERHVRTGGGAPGPGRRVMTQVRIAALAGALVALAAATALIALPSWR